MSVLMMEAYPAPAAMTLPCTDGDAPDPAPRGLAVSAADPLVLFEALRSEVNLAIWHRDLPGAVAGQLSPLMRHAPFCATAEATPEEAVEAILAQLPDAAPAGLLGDIRNLAAAFASLLGRETVAVRLEAITGRACYRWHADAVGLRLLTTYRGAGTEWLALPGGRETARALGPGPVLPPHVVQTVPPGAVAVLKGEGYPGNAGWGCIHRSPPAAPGPRARLLLCLDEPGRIPRA